MVELPLGTQRELAAQQDRLTIPAMYDNLTWYERRLVREAYALIQKGGCYFCKQMLEQPVPGNIQAEFPLDPRRWGPEFLKHPIHLHHDHRSGLTLGATHAYCNAILAQYYGE